MSTLLIITLILLLVLPAGKSYGIQQQKVNDYNNKSVGVCPHDKEARIFPNRSTFLRRGDLSVEEEEMSLFVKTLPLLYEQASWLDHGKSANHGNNSSQTLLKTASTARKIQRAPNEGNSVSYLLSRGRRSLASLSLLIQKVSLFDVMGKGDSAFISLLLHVIKKDLADCDILIGFDKGYRDPLVLQRLSSIPNAKQILFIESPTDFASALWTSNRCRGYLFMLEQSQFIMDFVNQDFDSWDYDGRFVFVGLSLEDVNYLVTSRKGRKTENIIAVVKSRAESEWNIYMNQLYSTEVLQKIDTWRNKFTLESNLFPDKLSNLRGTKIKITTFPWGSEVLYYKDESGSILFRYGIDIETIEVIARKLNFTIFYQEPPNGELWGEMTKNGSWKGMMGMLQRDETDVAFPLYVTVIFLGILDYSVSYKYEKSCVAVMTEPPLPRWQALSYPFNKWTWLSILIGFIVSGPVLYIMSRFSRKFGEEIKAFHSLPGTFQYAFGMHLNEPLDRVPQRPSTQIYILFLWLYCFILTIAYSTNLTAFMTVQKLPHQIETLKELHDSGAVLVGLNNFYRDMFLTTPYEYLQNLAKGHLVIPTQDEAFQRMREGGYAFPGNIGFLEFIKDTIFSKNGGESDLRILKESYASHTGAMALQRHSPLRRKFDQVIDGMQSAGLLRRFYLNAIRLVAVAKKSSDKENVRSSDKDIEEEEEEENVDSGGLVPLSLDHLQGIFFISICGWILSFLVFVCETLQ